MQLGYNYSMMWMSLRFQTTKFKRDLGTLLTLLLPLLILQFWNLSKFHDSKVDQHLQLLSRFLNQLEFLDEVCHLCISQHLIYGPLFQGGLATRSECHSIVLPLHSKYAQMQCSM
jgi:hypothetical protein